jgi:hypothetical protein
MRNLGLMWQVKTETYLPITNSSALRELAKPYKAFHGLPYARLVLIHFAENVKIICKWRRVYCLI